jgi:hypothetical protein
VALKHWKRWTHPNKSILEMVLQNETRKRRMDIKIFEKRFNIAPVRNVGR